MYFTHFKLKLPDMLEVLQVKERLEEGYNVFLSVNPGASYSIEIDDERMELDIKVVDMESMMN